MSKPEEIVISCPLCGEKTSYPSEWEWFTCPYCGLEYIVERNGGVLSLISVDEVIYQDQAGFDKTDSERAIHRFTLIIGALEHKKVERSMHYNEQIAYWGGLGGMLPALAVWILGVKFFGAHSWGVVFLGMIVFLAIFGLIYKNRKRKLEMSHRRLDAQIEELRDRVKRHKEIVDGE